MERYAAGDEVPEDNSLIDEWIEWLWKYHPEATVSGNGHGRTWIKYLEHAKFKYSIGKGIWDHTPLLVGFESFCSLQKKSMIRAVHAMGEIFMNLREMMHLMGLPHEFNIVEKAFATKSNREKTIKMVSQNVPVTTARDMADEVKKFLEGQLEMSTFVYMKQDNLRQTMDKQSAQHLPPLENPWWRVYEQPQPANPAKKGVKKPAANLTKVIRKSGIPKRSYSFASTTSPQRTYVDNAVNCRLGQVGQPHGSMFVTSGKSSMASPKKVARWRAANPDKVKAIEAAQENRDKAKAATKPPKLVVVNKISSSVSGKKRTQPKLDQGDPKRPRVEQKFEDIFEF